MKKGISVFLCIALICFACTACNANPGPGDTTAPETVATIQSLNDRQEMALVGRWQCRLDMLEIMGSMLGTDVDMSAYTGELVLEMNWEFASDGTYQMVITDDAWNAFLKGMEDMYKTIIREVFKASIQQANPNITIEEYLDAANMTWDDVYEGMNIEASMEAVPRMENSSGFYKVEDGKLYTTEEAEFEEEDGTPFALTEDELRVSLTILEGGPVELTLMRVK